MDIFSLDAEIKKLILLRQEGEYWDFKKEWHINKADLLHDIICMANNPSLHDGFIVIGINEETDFSVCDVVNDPNSIVSHTIMSLYWHFGNFCVKGNPNR